MKTLVLLFSMLISLSGCNDDNADKQKNSIIGAWEFIELQFTDDELVLKWRTVENGYTYTFNSDDSFTSNRFSECSKGNYSISKNKLTLNYGCSDFNTGIETPAGTFIENYILEGEYLTLTPTYLFCIEGGCVYKFKRISKE